MYIISFNINQKDGKEIRVLTEYPTLIINEQLSEIIFQIRTIIKEHFINISNSYKIPLIDMKLGLSILYTKDGFMIMDSCSINLINVRETMEIIKDLSTNDK